MAATPTVAPFGTWKSPIGVELLGRAASVNEVVADSRNVNEDVLFVESRPEDGGRCVAVASNFNTREDAFGEGFSARTAVHEYGGAAAAAHKGVLFFSDFATSRIHRVSTLLNPVPVTPENSKYRYGDFQVHPQHSHLLASILEDHSTADVQNSLVLVDTTSSTITTLCSGADFYVSPTWSPDGKQLAWVEWYHPDMCWEGALLNVATFNVTAPHMTDTVHVAGERGTVSVQQPCWLSSDRLLFLSDQTGYFSPHVYTVSTATVEALVPPSHELAQQDFGEPQWELGSSSIAVAHAGTVLFVALRNGFNTLWTYTFATRQFTPIPCDYVTIEGLRRVTEGVCVFLGRRADRPLTLVQVTTAPNDQTQFKAYDQDPSSASVPPAALSTPKGMAFSTDAAPLHVVFYPPTNGAFTAPAGEKPPCIVNAHGGPTWRAHPGLDWVHQYFTSRGWAWVDVNYGGSSGYGRAYRERLRGKWGIVDVDDCVAAVAELAKAGLIDPKRVVIRGGSAGGYTVLQAAVHHGDVFAAATSLYGISDLARLAADTHKFESRYCEKLLGGTPAEVPDVYRERSPVWHADRITTPLLILQGLLDAVVPPSQALSIVDAIEKKGGRVKYVPFAGEGHGWSKAETIRQALLEEAAFYNDVFGLSSV